MDVAVFLKKISKKCDAHAGKFASWQELMTCTGEEMKAKGIPIKQRKWIATRVEKFKQGFDITYIDRSAQRQKQKAKKKALRVAREKGLMSKRV